jgi:hypothetical protein
MSDKTQRPPAGQPWVWLTREVLASDAWRLLGINARRFIDFLLLEHMGKGGRHNGQLKAPHRQLRDFGIAVRFIGDAIRQAEDLGLVDCHRGGLRVATRFGLTWLPGHDGKPPTNRWRTYREPAPRMPSGRKIKNLPYKGEAGLPYKGEADGLNLPNKGEADGSKNLPYKGEALLRKDLTTAKPKGDVGVARSVPGRELRRVAVGALKGSSPQQGG